MKKVIFVISILALCVASGHALSLREGFEQIKSQANLRGVESGQWKDIGGGWIDYLPIENGEIAYKIHEVGSPQTSFYGTDMMNVISVLPKEDYIIGAQNWQNIICFFAHPIDKDNSELLIFIDQAYQGKTTAALCKVSNHVVELLRQSEIQFTRDHKIVLKAPVMVCD